jgi:hypothetical protein
VLNLTQSPRSRASVSEVCRKRVTFRAAEVAHSARPILGRVSQRHRRALVSIGSTICLVFAALAPALLDGQREPPAYALSSSVVFYLERSLATFLISYIVLSIVVRSVILSELPSAISKEGLTWPDEMSAATKAALETLQTQFEILEHDLDELAEHVALGDRLP